MKNFILSFQIGLVFVGSIVGAGLSSGRELTQFFAIYGYKSFFGLFICALLYVIVGKMIIFLSIKYKVKSYGEFINLVCPKPIAIFTNIILTLFLLCSTSIILAGSGSVIKQYFGIDKIFGIALMIVISVIFLLRETKGIFEVNNVTVPILIIIMVSIFIGYGMNNQDQMNFEYIVSLPYHKKSYLISSFVYAGFNIISIVGILVPLASEIQSNKLLLRGVVIGSIILTIISIIIVFLMMVNPTYAIKYEIPILAVAQRIAPWLQVALLFMIWLEMFSSQISNIYGLTKTLETKFNISYRHGVFLSIVLALPLSSVGFTNLVDMLYPLYGVLSLAFVICVITFYTKQKVSLTKVYN
ncbi:transporter [Candidatus Epulonipiscium viviparus]|uniref:YkvI family membrane protein n=1 Tax=Candidatus Epulonipiscium viviparus TaxID=420336 RepID=UPI00016C031F|nr:transporter [Candidatus Epulopiscium viviparus]